MKIVVTRHAVRDLDSQIDFLLTRGNPKAARDLEVRVSGFIVDVLARHPWIGKPLDHRDLRESWIPGTKLVVWYRVREANLEIARFWHTAQNRGP
jgi:plasmid stabilization system protein ParE